MTDDDGDHGGKWAAIIVALVMAVPIVAILATQSPPALITLMVVGFLAWAGIRTGVLERDEETADAASSVDPLATLQERYAAGELTEKQFEQRLDRLLASDQRAADAEDLDPTALEQEPAFERE